MSRTYNKNRPLGPAPMPNFTEIATGIVAERASPPVPSVVFTDVELLDVVPFKATTAIPQVVFSDPIRPGDVSSYFMSEDVPSSRPRSREHGRRDRKRTRRLSN